MPSPTDPNTIPFSNPAGASPLPNAAPTTPHSEFPTPDSSPPRRRGRPRRLSENDLFEICAAVSGGLGLEEAAGCVRCSVNTIRREARRNPEFEKRLHNSQLRAQLHPLHAMQKAAATHWRAAAWMLERMFPERFGRPDSGSFGAREARELMREVLLIVGSEISDDLAQGVADRADIKNRIKATFEYYLHRATSCRRTRRGLHQQTQLAELKNRPVDRYTKSGDRIPAIEELFPEVFNHRPPKPSRPATPAKPAVAPPAVQKITPVGGVSDADSAPTQTAHPPKRAPQPTDRSLQQPVAPSQTPAARPAARPAIPPAATTLKLDPHSTQRPPQRPSADPTDDAPNIFRELVKMLSGDAPDPAPDSQPKTSDNAPPKTQ